MIYHPLSDEMVKAINDDCYLVVAAKLDLKSGVTCVHTGTGNLIIAGEVYQGVGQLGAVESVKEGLSTSPTQLLLSLSGFDSKLVGEVLNERSRGRDVRLMLVAIDEDNGQPTLADVIFAGQIANLSVTTGEENKIGLTVSNRFERWSMGLPDRFTDESWSKRHNGDRIFRYVAQMAERSIYWGSKKDAPAFIYK
ncbi:hypothetical protein M0J40_RS00385 [Providencia rettgeri]|uniref:hypothetical protein n=1 Tax=Providencia TaxID=586 RepID=UPI001EFEB422|nr:hypothetical protein [Providencia huaxiensis]EJD6041090.1 hypothetical protein [Providencia rettgeri]ELR5127561.1 hypothetical protein [Providencia rettgeri]ELR5243761.1 hypothetical protein [Providencia rettgeri]ELS4585752.1 hypothetical protein [Providencia rettgeri]MCG9534374.1 hypothetical protein [Providencia huaxiensis]